MMCNPKRFIGLMSLLGCLAVLYACSTPHSTDTADQGEATVEIDQSVHFLTPDGEDVIVSPGAYEIKVEKDGLRLIAEEGTSAESIVIDAESAKHEESVKNPTAIMLSEEKDSQVITLLLPDGKRWEASGSESGIHSRAARRPRSSSALMKRRINIKNQATLLQTQLTLSSVSVKYKGTKRPQIGKKSKTTWQLPVNDTINSGAFTFGWTGHSGKLPAQRRLIPNKIRDFQNLVKKKHCCIKVLINGKVAPLSKISFGRDGSLLTTANLKNARAKSWPKNVKLLITKDKKKWESHSTKIYAKAISYYATVLHPIFSHERCTTCHTLGNRQAIVAMHQERLGEGSYPDSPDAVPHNPSFCGSCHNTQGSGHTDIDLTNEWFSPADVQGLNWKGWDAGRVCHKVTGPFTNKDGVVGPPVDLNHHFHDDPRITWAVISGWVPFGRPDLPVPMKNNLQGWLNKVDPWVAAGAPCPTWSKFFHRSKRSLSGRLAPRR